MELLGKVGIRDAAVHLGATGDGDAEVVPAAEGAQRSCGAVGGLDQHDDERAGVVADPRDLRSVVAGAEVDHGHVGEALVELQAGFQVRDLERDVGEPEVGVAFFASVRHGVTIP